MSKVVPKIAVPFRVSGSSVATVEQDSEEEVAGCVYAVVATELGARQERPAFGVTSPAFRQNGVDLAEVQAAVGRWEPRAHIAVAQDLIDSLNHVRIEVEA